MTTERDRVMVLSAAERSILLAALQEYMAARFTECDFSQEDELWALFARIQKLSAK